MNHKDIFERTKALETERAKGYEQVDARINKEQESLQEICGHIGHLATEAGRGPFHCGSECVVCGADVDKQVEAKVLALFDDSSVVYESPYGPFRSFSKLRF